MFSQIWHSLFFDPIYNALVSIIDVVPHGDIGLAIVVLTILVKVCLLPLSISAARTQRIMRTIEPKLAKIKEQYKDNREALARETFALYKTSGARPFASILMMLIQIPVVIALYLSVYSGGGVALPKINTDLLYSFVPAPETVSMMFLGMIAMAGKSLPLAFLAGITQYVQAHLSFQNMPTPSPSDKPSFKDDFARSMQLQMKYGMPIVIFFVAYTISAAIALYFLISNIVGIIQEFVVRSHR
jgi:YidC/Oxa1 family membrane protein insertase